MGFFSDLKADLSQAVNELMPEDARRPADEKLAGEDKLSAGGGLPVVEDDIPELSALRDLPEPKHQKIIFHKVPEGMENVRMMVPSLREDSPQALGSARSMGPADGTVVAENTTITGELVTQGAVRIARGARFMGNIHAAEAVIAGAVKGDIDVKGPVTLEETAIVVGNIRCKSVQIDTGGVIEGMCSLSYSDVKPAVFFEEVKKENTEPEA